MLYQIAICYAVRCFNSKHISWPQSHTKEVIKQGKPRGFITSE